MRDGESPNRGDRERFVHQPAVGRGLIVWGVEFLIRMETVGGRGYSSGYTVGNMDS